MATFVRALLRHRCALTAPPIDLSHHTRNPQATISLLPFYDKFAKLCTFTILRQNLLTFTVPPPYAQQPGAPRTGS